jgi:hypothetical protein
MQVHSRRSLPCFEAASAPFLPPTANRTSEKGTTMTALCHDATQSMLHPMAWEICQPSSIDSTRLTTAMQSEIAQHEVLIWLQQLPCEHLNTFILEGA